MISWLVADVHNHLNIDKTQYKDLPCLSSSSENGKLVNHTLYEYYNKSFCFRVFN